MTKLPKWIRVLPLGKVELADNREPFEVDSRAVEQMVAAFKSRGIDMVIDYEHQSLAGERAPAAGWIKDLEARPDGLWAKTEWTPKAQEYLSNREYRYFSPVLRLDPETRKPIALLHLGLTNVPAIKRLPPLVAKQEGFDTAVIMLRDFSAEERKQGAQEGWAMPDGSFPIKSREDVKNAVQAIGRAKDQQAAMKHIIARAKALGCMDLLPADWAGGKQSQEGKTVKNKLLGLPGLTALKAESTDDEVIAALSEQLKMAAALPEIAVALGLEKDADVSKIKGTALALKVGQDQLTALKTEVAELKNERIKDKAQVAVDEALKARKITAAQKDWALKLAQDDPESFKAFVAQAPEVVPGGEGLKTPQGAAGATGLTAAEQAVCKQMGVPAETFKTRRDDMAAA